MLSLQQCRAILGRSARDMSDAQVEALRERLYHLARLGIDMFVARRDSGDGEAKEEDPRN